MKALQGQICHKFPYIQTDTLHVDIFLWGIFIFTLSLSSIRLDFMFLLN